MSQSLRDSLPDGIGTQRLTLRAPMPDDLAALVHLANNWAVLQPTAALPYPYLEEHGRGFLERVVHQPGQRPYAIVAADGALMGIIALYFAEGRVPEIGYWLGEPYWGQGFASEAVGALVDAAKGCGIEAINARVLVSNPGSVRVLEKAGFTVTEETLSVVERHLGKPLLILGWVAS